MRPAKNGREKVTAEERETESKSSCQRTINKMAMTQKAGKSRKHSKGESESGVGGPECEAGDASGSAGRPRRLRPASTQDTEREQGYRAAI